MAKVTITFIDNEDGTLEVEFLPEPNFEGDSLDLTMAQDAAMRAMEAVTDEADYEPLKEPTLQ